MKKLEDVIGMSVVCIEPFRSFEKYHGSALAFVDCRKSISRSRCGCGDA